MGRKERKAEVTSVRPGEQEGSFGHCSFDRRLQRPVLKVRRSALQTRSANLKTTYGVRLLTKTRFDGPVSLQFLAVSCSPTAFFKHLYRPEQRPFNPVEFGTRQAVSAGWNPGLTTESGRNDEVNAVLAND
jgi:hypothetical protein